MGCEISSDIENHQQKYKFSSHLFVQPQQTFNNPQNNSQSMSKLETTSIEDKLDRSITYYQQFLQANPNLKYPFDGLGNIEDQAGYLQGNIQGWYEQSRESGLINGNPYDALSLCYSLKKEVSQAQKWYQHMIVLHPLSQYLYFGLGNIYYKMGLLDEAEDCYRKSIEINPRLDKAYQNIANIYCFKRYDNSHAEQWSKFALKLSPNNQYAALIKALVEQNLNNKILLLEKLSKTYPKYARIFNAWGYAHLEMKDYNKAIQIFTKGYQLNPHYYALACGLALCYNQLGKFDQAIGWSQVSMDLNSSHHQPYHGLGDSFRGKGNLIQAKKWFEKCIKINPQLEQTYLQIARICLQLSDEQAAITYYQNYLEINDENIEVLLEISRLYLKRQAQKSVDYLLKVLRIQNQHEQALFMVASIFQEHNRQEESQSLFRDYLQIAKDRASAQAKVQEVYNKYGKIWQWKKKQ